MIRKRSLQLVSSEPINEEIMEVITRPKFQDRYHLQNALFDVAFILCELAELVIDMPLVKISSDPDDDKFLAAAIGGCASHLITGDVGDLLHLHEYQGVTIVSPKEFLIITQKE